MSPTTATAPYRVETRIHSISSEILDVPTIREHKLANLAVTEQSIVLVRVKTTDGVEGVGEAATLGGPRWSEESVETIKAVVDHYLCPALVGHTLANVRAAGSKMQLAAKRNNAAKTAVETAILDALGKTLSLPVHVLLGGVVRSHVPVIWALASGNPHQEVEEALSMIENGRHRKFKVKIGAAPPASDIARLTQIAKGLQGKGELAVVDANQAWDEPTAMRWIPALEEIGVGLLEQPLPAWNIEGLARIKRRFHMPILADESAFDAHDVSRIGGTAAADAISLKLVKHGGLWEMLDVAATARAAGLGLYGGCLLEGPVGTAAHLHAFATLPGLEWGTESFGPLIMQERLTTKPLVYRDFGVEVPMTPGVGITLDESQVAKLRRVHA